MSALPDPDRGVRAHLSAVPDPDWTGEQDAAAEDALDLDRPDAAADEPVWSGASYALFDGDQGGLELEQRRALVALVKYRFISSETHPQEWKALVASPDAIVARLNDQFLTLHLDRDREVAWKRQAQPEAGGSFPTLLYDAAWNREATIALVFLRSRQRAEAMAGNDTAFVDREEILSYLEAVRPDSATDQSGDAKRAAKAIDDLYSAKLLLGRKTGDRFQIARAIEALLPLDTLKRLSDAITAQHDTTDDTHEGPEPAAEPDTGGAAPGTPSGTDTTTEEIS